MEKKIGNFLYDIISKVPLYEQAVFVGKYVRDLKVDSKEKLEQAFIFLQENQGKTLDAASFEQRAGVGIVTSLEAVS